MTLWSNNYLLYCMWKKLLVYKSFFTKWTSKASIYTKQKFRHHVFFSYMWTTVILYTCTTTVALYTWYFIKFSKCCSWWILRTSILYFLSFLRYQSLTLIRENKLNLNSIFKLTNIKINRYAKITSRRIYFIYVLDWLY